MAVHDAEYARNDFFVAHLLKDELEADPDLASLPEAEQQAKLDELAIIWKAGNMLTDTWQLVRDFMLSHGIEESDANDLMLQFKEDLD